MNDDITRMLSGAVPDDPDTGNWAEAVRRRDRRRRNGRAAGVLALIAAVVVPAGIFLANQVDPGIPAEPALSTPPNPPPSGDNPCEDLLDRMRDGDDVTTALPGGELPAEPTRAWLCGDPQQSWAGPAEPLGTGLDEVIATFNGFDVPGVDIACTDEYAMRYLTVFDYEDTFHVVLGELHGCRLLTSGQERRFGGEEFLDQLTGAWLEQRDHPRSAVEEADCSSANGTLLPADPQQVIAGFGCLVAAEQSHDEPLPADLLTRVQDSLASDDLRSGSYAEVADDTLVLADPWGATIGITPLAGGGFLVQNGSPLLYPYHHWFPSAELEEDVLAYLDAPQSAGEPGVPPCFDGEPAELPVEGVTSAFVCQPTEDGTARGFELDVDTAEELAAQAAELLEESPTEPETMPGGGFGALVLLRADGTGYVLERGDDDAFYLETETGEIYRFAPVGELAETAAQWFD